MTTSRRATRQEALVFGADCEFDENDKPIEKGHGSKHAKEHHVDAVWPDNKRLAHELVFGVTAKTDAEGRPVETGIALNSAAIIAKANATKVKP